MEIWSCKSSTRDESKISQHVSDVSAALRRLAFLPDTCQATCQPTCHACAAHVIHMKRLIHEKYNTRAKRANVLKALNRLAFCISTCVRHVQHVLMCVAHAAQGMFDKTCVFWVYYTVFH